MQILSNFSQILHGFSDLDAFQHKGFVLFVCFFFVFFFFPTNIAWGNEGGIINYTLFYMLLLELEN